jgi:methionyl-tRNA synthetase
MKVYFVAAFMPKFYVTTSIAYVNAKPHIGYAMEVVQADVLARFHRLKGDETFYQTGTDEHGMKLVQTAKDRGITAKELVDQNAEFFRALKGQLNLSYDHFIRTTDESHMRGAQKLWKKMMAKGDIYKDSYEGLYCVGCEAFVMEKDLVDGKCPNHNKEPEKLKEENYFFRLSKYADKIKYAIEVNELKIVPQSRKHELLSLINEGLKDVSFSRPKHVLQWGIEVPDDPDQTMYVWCDALSNYITGIGYEDETEQFKKFWPADVHLIGKDILRFHAAIWIGMLLSAGLQLPESIYVHGFITSEGKKMSKSLNNVVDPAGYVDKYGVDALRYFLLKEIPTTDDGDFSKERFNVVYESELANNIGNLVSRVLAMNVKYFDGKVPAADRSNGVFKADVAEMWKKYQAAIGDFDLKKALEIVVDLAMRANKFVDDTKPWVLAKGDQEELARVIYALLEMIRQIALMLLPFIPGTAEKIFGYLGQDVSMVGADFAETIKWGGLKEGTVVSKAEPLFARIAE